MKNGNIVEVLYGAASGSRRWVVLIDRFKRDYAGVWMFEGSYYDPTNKFARIETDGGFTMSDMVSIMILDPKKTLFDAPVIKIKDDIVQFVKDGVQVGCTFVDINTVDAIYKQLHK